MARRVNDSRVPERHKGNSGRRPCARDQLTAVAEVMEPAVMAVIMIMVMIVVVKTVIKTPDEEG
jgi:hypothetical protein